MPTYLVRDTKMIKGDKDTLLREDPLTVPIVIGMIINAYCIGLGLIFAIQVSLLKLMQTQTTSICMTGTTPTVWTWRLRRAWAASVWG